MKYTDICRGREKLSTMSLLYYDGEYIEIPEYIIRIVKRAQTMVTKEVEDDVPTLDLIDGNLMSAFVANEAEPSVVGPSGTIQTVSEYILGIIRAAQKVVQDCEDTEDIRDYDQFIESTFDAMLNEAEADNSEEPGTIVHGVVDQLIEEVCSSPKLKNLKMPEMNSSEDIAECKIESKEISMESPENKTPTDEESDKSELNVTCVDSAAVDANIITENHNEVESDRSSEEENVQVNEEHLATVSVEQIISDSINEQSAPDTEENNEESEAKQDKETKSDEELEKIVEKFVENICNEAKNIVLLEQANKTNDDTDNATMNPDAAVDPTSQGAKLNGQIDQDLSQNHSAKVHPEEAKPEVANFEDITKSDSLPTEGKHGKGQKYNVSKDKIKTKRRSRSIRNSFRRMFSCFSTKSSQLE